MEYINNTEYIDRKELVNNINRLVKLTNKDEQEWVKDECIRQAYCIQKADVVPRSEYDDLELKLEAERSFKPLAITLAKQEVASKLIDDIVSFIWQSRGESFCLLIDGTFYGKEEMKEFLRKKYIGE